MSRNKFIFTVILCLTTVFALGFAACDLGVAAADAEDPVISTQPNARYSFVLGGAMDPIVIIAVSPDGGTLSYQWYSYTTSVQYRDETGTEISGETGASYTPDLSETGVYNFYVIVTNTKGSTSAAVQSNRITVTVQLPASAAYPDIIKQQDDLNLYYAGSALQEELAIHALSPDGGVLSYQWYSSGEYANEGGTLIPSATGASYTVTVNGLGEYYYYVEVTNTVAGVGSQMIAGDPVVITLMATEDKTFNAIFTVDTATKYQYVRGFGGMSVLWDNFPDDTVADYEKMYNPDKLGYNMLRIMIPPDDTDIDAFMEQLIANESTYSTDAFYQANPTAPNQIKDQSDYYDLVKVVNKYSGYVLASPWSAPAVWKTNNSITAAGNGQLKPANYGDYGIYLGKFAKNMYNNGAPLYAISIQNEPDYTGDYDGCRMTGANMRDILLASGRFTNGIKGIGGGTAIDSVKILIGDVANLQDTATKIDPVLDNATTKAIADIVGYHIYGDTNTRTYQKALDANKEMWMTEYNINSGSASSYPQDSTWNYMWQFANCIDMVIRGNSSNSFIWWASKRFYSMIGDGTYGTVNGETLPRGYALSHYAKFAKEMNRVGVTASGTTGAGAAVTTTNVNPTFSNYATNTGVKVTAYVSPDGNTISLVMFTPAGNSGNSGVNMGSVKIQLPAGFIIRSATAMRSTADVKAQMETVPVGTDRNSAVVSLPASNFLSVRFTK